MKLINLLLLAIVSKKNINIKSDAVFDNEYPTLFRIFYDSEYDTSCLQYKSHDDLEWRNAIFSSSWFVEHNFYEIKEDR